MKPLGEALRDAFDDRIRDHYREKRRARQMRRLAKMACNPRATTRHRAPCGDCYYCRRIAA